MAEEGELSDSLDKPSSPGADSNSIETGILSLSLLAY